MSKDLAETISQLSNAQSSFEEIEKAISSFREPSFLNLSLRKRFKYINHLLCDLIRKSEPPTFLLHAVLNYFERVNQEKILREPFDLPAFEFWLNNFSELSDKENSEIRGKIIGKNIPRDSYQVFFPIGMGKNYFGTHYVTAHLSPDIDTMIASFWGWADAFAARVGTGIHLWALPGGPPDSPVTAYFKNMISPSVFSSIARTSPSLALTAMDLLTQRDFSKLQGETLISDLEHGKNEKAIILIDEKGHYLGDWRSSDVEPIRHINILFKACLHWFENNFHTKLISFFAKLDVSIKDLPNLKAEIFSVKIKDCQPARDFNDAQKQLLHDFFYTVLNVKKGLDGTFKELITALDALSLKGMVRIQNELDTFAESPLFDQKGILKENRPEIFNYLNQLIKHLDVAILEVRNYVERLDVVLKIKYHVLNIAYTYLTLRSDVNEIKQKMQNRDFLTVVITEQDGSFFPVGVVKAKDLREQGLGTVSMRDFCNFDEVKMASYLEVISVIDHHKSNLKTFSVPTAIIGDAQSCNVLIAEKTFELNDRYSLGGMSIEDIDRQIAKTSSNLNEPSRIRILGTLLKRKSAAQQLEDHYIDPKREFCEYLSFLQAILDDTDLLTKVSHRDIACVSTLLNRMKSLSLREEVEIIHFDDLPNDKSYLKQAALRILQQADMYSLYKQIYSLKESEVEANLNFCIQDKYTNIFLDTKIQNGCARVGQTKIFSSNVDMFLKNADKIRQMWLNDSQKVYNDNEEIDLHLHMMSTVASAEEVYHNRIGPYDHQDELWFWVAPTHTGYHHLHSFLAGFQFAVDSLKPSMSIEFCQCSNEDFENIFKTHFPEIQTKKMKASHPLPMAILRFQAGALNSRKSMITPFLPKI